MRMLIKAKHPSKCNECDAGIQRGDTIVWDKDDNGKSTVWHLDCDEPEMPISDDDRRTIEEG